MEEFQLVDLSRRFLNLDSFWTLPRQFLDNKVKSKIIYRLYFTSPSVEPQPENDRICF